MTKDFTEKAGQILDTIKSSKKILLHCHAHSDADSICSVLSMTAILRKMNKEVTPILGDSEYPKYLGNLPYKEWLIPKNYTEIDPQEYDLFIVLDSSNLSRITELSEVVFPETLKTINIDHHRDNSVPADINLVEQDTVSTCEILFRLFREWGIDIEETVALLLFMGVYSDSGGFKYGETNFSTFAVASELTKIYPSYHPYLFDLDSHAREIDLKMMGVALTHLEKYFSDQVVLTALPYEELIKYTADRDEMAQALVGNTLRTVRDWRIVGSLVEMAPGEVKVSLRTRYEDEYDITKIVKSIGEGGGGHKGAGGTTIWAPIEKAKQDLLETIVKIYPSLK